METSRQAIVTAGCSFIFKRSNEFLGMAIFVTKDFTSIFKTTEVG